MKKLFSLAKEGAGILFVLGLALCLVALSQWGLFPPRDPGFQFTQGPRVVDWPTPVVDIEKARQALDSGGELTYDEIEALRREVQNAPSIAGPEIITGQNGVTTYIDREGIARNNDFAAKLKKCKLKETMGWIAGFSPAMDKDDKLIPGNMRVRVYLRDPYSEKANAGSSDPYTEMYIAALPRERAARMKYGQRIRFSGDLFYAWGVFIRNARYELLEDDPPAPTLADAELDDLNVVLSRSFGADGCPQYTLTITPDGSVTFVGRVCTGGAPTGRLGRAQLAEIAREVKKADFFNMKNDYDSGVFDGPRQTLSVQMEGKSKTVRNNGAAPVKLYVLMNRIDQITNTGQP